MGWLAYMGRMKANARWKWMFTMLLILCGIGASAHAQSLFVPALHPAFAHQSHSLGLTPSGNFAFPKEVQRNPMGYAPLCMLELKIERKLPVGLWIRADGAANRPGYYPGLAYFRLKMPLGK